MRFQSSNLVLCASSNQLIRKCLHRTPWKSRKFEENMRYMVSSNRKEILKLPSFSPIVEEKKDGGGGSTYWIFSSENLSKISKRYRIWTNHLNWAKKLSLKQIVYLINKKVKNNMLEKHIKQIQMLTIHTRQYLFTTLLRPFFSRFLSTRHPHFLEPWICLD